MMSILDYLTRNLPLNRKKTASVAKERLQLILSREHATASGPDYLPALQKELLAVISKYTHIDLDDIKINVEKDGDCEILELNIALPETQNKVA